MIFQIKIKWLKISRARRRGGGHLVAQAAFYVLDENIVAATVTEASSFGE